MDSQNVGLLLNSKTQHTRLASSTKLEGCTKDFFGSEVPGEEGPGKGTKRNKKQALASAAEGPEVLVGTGCHGCESLRRKTELILAVISIGQL